MPRYQIIPATQEHVMAMLPHVRQADRDEVLASTGLPMDQVLSKCVALSDMAWAGLVDDEVGWLFGVRGQSMLSDVGIPWLIGTDLIEAHAKLFLRRNTHVVGMMLDRYPHLINLVDVRNTKAKQWLEFLGFTLYEPMPHGPYLMPFQPFDMKANRDQPRYQIVPATQEHVAAMLPNVRQSDRDEVLAASGLPMDQVLGKCVSLSEMSWAGLINGKVACLFGVRGQGTSSLVGVPWMIATDLIEAHAKPFLRRSRKVVQMMLDRYPHLANYVDVRNTTSMQWLEWLGFTLHEPVPYGPYQMLFHPFEMKANHV